MKKVFSLLTSAFFTAFLFAQVPCVAPDNGSGTTDFPPITCAWHTETPLLIVDGLPPGSSIEVYGDFIVTQCGSTLCPTFPPGLCEMPGGSLGGTQACFNGEFVGYLVGTGSLAGYFEEWISGFEMLIELSDRTPGETDQHLNGLIIDFKLISSGPSAFTQLDILMGNSGPLPHSPGPVRLSELPGGDWHVDSFFDITYRIDFHGAPGGPLSGMSGSNVLPGAIRMGVPVAEGACCYPGPPGCLQQTEVKCLSGGGTYHGDGSDCGAISCGPDTGYFSIAFGPDPSLPPLYGEGWNQFLDTTNPNHINGWYYYPSEWWNIWYYNDPFDSTRWKEAYMEFELGTFTPGLPSEVIIALNYSTPEWSLQGDTTIHREPPLPGYPYLDEAIHIVRDTVLHIPAGTVLDSALTYVYCLVLPDYNPEWVSIDVQGLNYEIYQGMLIHECFPLPLPGLGRCCYTDASGNVACMDNTLCECQALGGQWDASLSCAQHPCPQPLDSGACCLPNKQCQQLDSASCAQAGGTYYGDNSLCDTVNCGAIIDTFNITIPPGHPFGAPPPVAGGSGQFDDGTGTNGWYWYENENWYNIWFYDHPLDSNRYKMVTIRFNVAPLILFGDSMELDFALNWATPDYSQAGFTTPPLPPLSPAIEQQYIGRHIFPLPPTAMDTTGSYFYELCYVFPDYNPEWVSIDVRGEGFEIFNGEIIHECIYGNPPPLGRCCYTVSGSDSVLCADNYACECDYLGGDWVDSLNCTQHPCQQPAEGACCLPNKQCQQMDSASCAQAGGTYYGDNSLCDTVNCGAIIDTFNITIPPGHPFGAPPPVAGGSGQFDDGTGTNGWYWYENENWYNIWFYDHPLDSNRYKMVTIRFNVAPLILFGDSMELDFALNWATPDYSQAGFTTPPLPPLSPAIEQQYIGRHIFPLPPTAMDTTGSYFYELCYVFPDYNPEWVSIDVRGEGFEIFNGEIIHECIYGNPPPLGRCCYTVSGSDSVLCADNYECECDYLGGDWVDSLNCAQHPCPQPAEGACCLPNKQCQQLDSAACAQAGGTYYGDNSLCDTVNCGPIIDSFHITLPLGHPLGAPPTSAGGTGQFDDGTGTNGWYWYENENWYNIWFYDHPLDSNRYKMVTIRFNVAPLILFGDSMELDFALNWATPDYSQAGFTTPPLPPLSPAIEQQYIGRHIFPLPPTAMDTTGSYFYELCYVFPDYNPEWVSIDVRGEGFEIFNGEIIHECIYGNPPPLGRCCYTVSGSDSVLCADNYECECDYLGGDWVDSLNCAQHPCPQPIDSGACCLPDGSCLESDSIYCDSIGGDWQGAGTDCDPNPCPQPQGACCMPDGSCFETVQMQCMSSGGSWQGVGTTCTPNPCPQPIDSGACCLPDGSCLESDSIYCDSIGGDWQGAGTDCDPNPCPQPQGACCMPDGSCFETVEMQCVTSGGIWMGPGVSCTPNPCPQVSDSGACCLLAGGCVYTTLEDCRDMCGKWLGYGVLCHTTNCPEPDTIRGVIVYINVAQTPLANVVVILTDTSRPHCSDTTVTGADGVFEFINWPGDYLLSAETMRPWVYGASNAVDALKVARHFVGLDTLLGLHLIAGDVNALFGVNSADALQILQRFSGLITSFAAGDWVFDTRYLNAAVKSPFELEGIIVGDVDASYVPIKTEAASLSMVHKSEVRVEGGRVDIPLYVDRDVNLSALSLELLYPEDALNVREVRLHSDKGVWVWNETEGKIRLAWYSLISMQWKAGEALLTLSLDITDDALLKEGDWLRLGAISEANDAEGRAINLTLIAPEKLRVGKTLFLGKNRPNPFSGMTEIGFSIPKEGMVRLEVFDALGQPVKLMVDDRRQEGSYLAAFDCSLCQPGLYFYRLTYTGDGEVKAITRRMVLTR